MGGWGLAAQLAGDDDLISAYQGETEIFIYPSYQYKVVDALVTNFEDLFNDFKLVCPSICFLDSYGIEKGQKLRRVFVLPSSK